MIGCNCRIHLGIQWPRIRCSIVDAQHQLGMLQGLCPTLPILIFSCASKLHAQNKGFIAHVLQCLSLNTNIKHSCVPEILAQHKTSHNHVLQRFLLNTKNQILMCSIASLSTQNIEYSCASELALNKNISSIMCSMVHVQHIKSCTQSI